MTHLILTYSNNPLAAVARADELDADGTVEDDLGKSREGSRTDDEVVQRFVLESSLSLNTAILHACMS